MDITAIRSRVRLSGACRSALLALALFACAATIGACGSSKSPSGTARTTAKLDTHRVALAIEQSIRSERHLRAKVVCPTFVAQQAGRTFVCVATILTGKRPHASTPFEVKVQNDKGYVTYRAK